MARSNHSIIFERVYSLRGWDVKWLLFSFVCLSPHACSIHVRINWTLNMVIMIWLWFSASWQNTNSCLMNKISQELKEHWRTHDLLRMMTSIVRHVVSYNRTLLSNENKLQAPTIVSTLSRLVYFDKTKYLLELSKNERIDFDPLD